MKPILLGSALAVSVLAAAPVIAADPQAPAATAAPATVVKAPPKAPSPLMEAMLALLREFERANDPQLPLPAVLDRMAAQPPAPENAARLRAVYGSDRPYAIEHRPGKAGGAVYHATLQPLHYQGANGATADWDEAALDFSFDKSGATVDLLGHWDTLDFQDPATHTTVNGIRLEGRQRRGFAGLWFGEVRSHIDSVHMTGKAAPSGHAAAGTPFDATFDDLNYDWRVSEGKKTVDIGYSGGIGKISAAGQDVDDVRFAIRIANVDKPSLAALRKETERQRTLNAALTPEQKTQAMLPLMRSFGAASLAHGAAIEIDEISARYHGNKASVTGRLSTPGASEADLGDMASTLKKLVARFEIKVPLALVRDVAGAVAARQPATQANPQAMGQNIADLMVGKAVNSGFARVEGDALVSTIEWRDGALRANGKPVPLPNMNRPAMPAQTVTPGASMELPAAPLPADALQARRIDASCQLPDYPAEVVSQNQALRLVLSYRVGVDGKVKNAAVARASRFPAWDQAALAALAQCAYIPALQGGQPIEAPMLWTIQREPGTARP